MTTHLTLTGYEAGRVICGADKTADNQYLHAMYAPQSLIDSDECCAKCRQMWNDAADESDAGSRSQFANPEWIANRKAGA